MTATELAALSPDYVRRLSPYVPGKPIEELAREYGLDEGDIVKLASNENPRGPSAKVQQAIATAASGVTRYPDGNGFALKSALAARFKLALEQIVLGNGSNDILELAARTFLTSSDSAIYSQHAFLVYPLVVQAIGAQPIVVPAQRYGTDLDAMAAAVRRDTKIVFIANPNNPTGTFNPWDKVRELLERVPERVLVVLDEAYGEYLPDALQSPSPRWLGRYPNLVVSRTLSKAFGLAGLRVGYGFAHPDVAELMNRVRQPFNVNHLAMVAACAALGDDEFIARSRSVNAAGLEQLREGFERLGLEYIASLGNFITVRVGDAARIYDALLRQGVIVRPIVGYGLPKHLRVTVGQPQHNARFLAALERALVKA
jgi:histidinol-phosphate aminotransferase